MTELMPKVANLFEFPAVQREMIEDTIRVNQYAKAIAACVESGDVVVDLGTGTGILAFLALRAGARKVYAIERQSVIEVARENASRNGLAGHIEFIHADSRFVDLPEKADCLISEVIGHFALEENMLDAMIDARARFLKPGGKMIPQTVDLLFAPTSTLGIYEQEIQAWENHVAGFDLSAGRDLAVNNVHIHSMASEDLLAKPARIAQLSLMNDSRLSVDGYAEFEILEHAVMTGIAGWFHAELGNGIFIDSSPFAPPTHWKQCFFPIAVPSSVDPNDRVTLEFRSKSFADDVVYSWSVAINPARRPQLAAHRFAHSTSRFINRDSLRSFWNNKGRVGSERPKQLLAKRHSAMI